MSAYHFIEPLDLLFLRGNKLFGEAGSYGAAQIPPWPSVAAGAVRSSILLREGVDLKAFSKGKVVHPELGTPAEPGSFRVTDFRLARRTKQGVIEGCYPLPADLVVSEKEDGSKRVSKLTPSAPPKGVASSFSLEKLPLLVEPERSKPVAGFWLNRASWQTYVQGKVPSEAELVASTDLWKVQDRTGIGIDAERGAVAEGRLFTVQGVALAHDVGFLLATSGVTVTDSHLRFGGDGRGAKLTTVNFKPVLPDYKRMVKERRCRLILTSPGLFAHGWCLPGMAEDGSFELQGVKGKVCSAAVSRTETVSGWDLAKGCPKTALRSAGIGSVYWLEELEATPEALAELLERGLWESEQEQPTRQAEGFNRFQFAIY